MFLDKYLNSTYLDLIYNNYNENYLNTLDEDNFIQIYNLLKKYNFYFIDDIILNYLELFEIKEEYVDKVLNIIKNEIGNNWIKEIGRNMTIIDKIIELANKYEYNDLGDS